MKANFKLFESQFKIWRIKCWRRRKVIQNLYEVDAAPSIIASSFVFCVIITAKCFFEGGVCALVTCYAAVRSSYVTMVHLSSPGCLSDCFRPLPTNGLVTDLVTAVPDSAMTAHPRN